MRAKKCLELSVRESHVRHSGHIGVEHIALGLLRADSSAVTHVLSELGVSAATLRMEILNRYRQAS
jgi:ATP-dependent Clp protease ATP-binding subunit ClpA